MLGGFFYGHSIGLVPLGLLLDRFQYVRTCTFILMLVATIIEFISPVVADWNWAASFTLRVLIGFTQVMEIQYEIVNLLIRSVCLEFRVQFSQVFTNYMHDGHHQMKSGNSHRQVWDPELGHLPVGH